MTSQRRAVAVLWGCPPLALIAALMLFAVDVPFFDQWAFVTTLQRSYEGSLTLFDLWSQHNEHRPLIPRLVWLGLARATAWNQWAEIAANMVLGCGVYFGLLVIARRAWRPSGTSVPNRLTVALSVVAFSFAQYENWLWGWTLQIWISVALVISAACLITRPRLRLGLVLAAGLLVAGSQYSYAAGAVFWPIGLAVLLRREAERTQRSGILTWSLLGLGATASYLYGYLHPAQHGSLLAGLSRPDELAAYVLAYLGSPVALSTHHLKYIAVPAGLVGVLLFLALTRRLVASGCATRAALEPCWALGWYAIGAAVLSGASRVTLGIEQAFASRYVTISMLLWAANLIMLLLWAGPATREAGSHQRPAVHLAWSFLAAALAFGSVVHLQSFHERRQYLAPARAELFRLKDWGLIGRLSSRDPQDLSRRIAFLRSQHLSVFRGANNGSPDTP